MSNGKTRFYAPEFPTVGAVMGGPLPNVTRTYNNVNKVPLAEVNIAAMLGVMDAYYELDKWMRADLKDGNHPRERFLFPLNKCAPMRAKNLQYRCLVRMSLRSSRTGTLVCKSIETS